MRRDNNKLVLKRRKHPLQAFCRECSPVDGRMVRYKVQGGMGLPEKPVPPGREVWKMSNISELDLQNLRHLIGGFDTTHCKMQAYAKEAEDPQVRQFFEKGARSAMDNKEQLMKFLN